MWKSIGVVLGCYVLSIVLVVLSDPLLSRLFPGDFEKGHVPSNTALLASTAFFVLASIFCAWLCARLAAGNAGKLVLWFFILGEVLGIASIIPNWSKGWLHWYWLSWLLSWPVACWIGLMLAGRRANQPSAAVS